MLTGRLVNNISQICNTFQGTIFGYTYILVHFIPPLQAVNGEHIRELKVQTRKHDYVDGTLIPVGGVPDSGNDGIEDGKFLVTDMGINSPLDPSTFPVLTRYRKDQL